MDDFKEDDNSGVTGPNCQGSLVAQDQVIASIANEN